MSAQHVISDFLAQKRFAMVGLSRNPKEFSRRLFTTLRQRGYDVVPVCTCMEEIDGVMCFASITEIDLPVQGAMLLTTPAETGNIVVECYEAGITRVWMHSLEGIGSVNPLAIDFCMRAGIAVVPGFCPTMFLPEARIPRHLHGFARLQDG